MNQLSTSLSIVGIVSDKRYPKIKADINGCSLMNSKIKFNISSIFVPPYIGSVAE